MTGKNGIKKAKSKLETDNERSARHDLLEDLFYDLHKNRVQVYKMNFIRGVFFGLGSILGGTIIIALFAWILSLFVDLPGVGSSIEQVQQSIQNNKK